MDADGLYRRTKPEWYLNSSYGSFVGKWISQTYSIDYIDMFSPVVKML